MWLKKISQVDSNVVCTVQKNTQMDEPTFLYWTESIWNQFSLSNQPECLLMDSCAVHETAAIKEALGNHGFTSFTSQGALQVAFKFSTLASTNRSSTTCDNSLRLLSYQMVKNWRIAHHSMGDWILGENYKGNHNEHVEINRLLKKYYEKGIPFFRTAMLSFLT